MPVRWWSALPMNGLRSILCGVLLLVSLCSFAQEKSLDAESLNAAYLEHLIKIGVDSVRQAHGLPSLYNGKILFTAADFHADYLLQLGRLSHTQNEHPDTRTPQLRAEHFGATNYQVGENVAYSYYNKRVEDKSGKVTLLDSYKAVAKSIVIGWVNSPGHYKNMITPDYQITGLAISIDPHKQRVYAVQKFAFVPFTYAFEEDAEAFPYSAGDYPKPPPLSKTTAKQQQQPQTTLENYEAAPCEACVVQSNQWQLLSKLEYKGSKVYLRIDNADMLRATITEKTDGLMMETVGFEQYVCANPNYSTMASRRNGQRPLNGYEHQFIPRKEIQKGYKRARKVPYKERLEALEVKGDLTLWNRITFLLKKRYEGGYFKTYLGDMADHEKGFGLQPNVLVIKDNKVCNVLRYTNYEGAELPAPPAPGFRPFPRMSDDLFPKPSSRFFYHSTYLDANQVEVEEEQLSRILDTIRNQQMYIDSLFIEARSSVEGSEAVNERLQLERAANMKKQFQDRQARPIRYAVKTGNSWDLFYAQLWESEDFKPLAELEQEELHKKLESEPLRDSLAFLLKQQRSAKVAIYAVEDTSGKARVEYLHRRLEQILGQLAETKPNELGYGPQMDIALYIQQEVFAEKPFEVEAPYRRSRGRAVYLIPLLIRHYVLAGADFKDPEVFLGLQKLLIDQGQFRAGFDPYTRFNFMAAYFKLDPKTTGLMPAASMQKLIEDQQLSLPEQFTAGLVEMNLALHFRLVGLYFKDGKILDEVKHKAELFAIYGHYSQQRAMSDEEALEIARYFVHHQETMLAFELLDERVDREDVDLELLAYHARLNYHYNGYQVKQNYADWVLGLRKRLGQTLWCELFLGKNNLSFQLFDHPQIRDAFCAECAEREASFMESLLERGEKD